MSGPAADQGSPAAPTPADVPAPWVLRLGNLEVRLAVSEAEIDAAQALRYRVFYQEMAARPSADMSAVERDFDDFDPIADHLLVIDLSIGTGHEAVVGTYRLLRRSVADRFGRFYTADEYDIGSLIAEPGEILELGRSCVAQHYRNGQTMQLLWRGIAAYIFQHDIGLMFGCASLPGTDVGSMAAPLSYLHHYHLAPPALRPRAVPERYVDMNRLGIGDFDVRRTLGGLPPLIKGYLRLGGCVGDGAVVDHQFQTTDVCVVVQTELVTERYYKYYEKREWRSAEDGGEPPLVPLE